MERRSFKRAALFGILGALVFLVVGAILCGVFPPLEKFVLFKKQELKADFIVVAVYVRFTLFVVIGFIVGWGYYLLEDTQARRRRKKEEE